MWFPAPLDPARQTPLTATLPEPNESREHPLRGVLNPDGQRTHQIVRLAPVQARPARSRGASPNLSDQVKPIGTRLAPGSSAKPEGDRAAETRLLVRRPAVKPRFKGVTGVVLFGGACARWRGCMLCARAPGLTSVRDPGWLRAGDMMFDGVVPLGEALRPLDLSRPSTRRWRQRVFGSGPRRICVSEGSTRTGVRRTGALDRRARAGCGSSA